MSSVTIVLLLDHRLPEIGDGVDYGIPGVLITKLTIGDLRVIEHLALVPSPGVNFIVGGNGAGKTSILEAIYLAGRGRTFRHASAGPMIRRGRQSTTVLVNFRGDADEAGRLLGLRRGRKEFECRLDGGDVRRRSTLAETLPVQWIGSQPQSFLERGPELRRRFFDMGLFHVEHDYLQIYAELSRTLKQRNAALKTGRPDAVTAWDTMFVQAALAMDARRQGFIAELMAATSDLINRWEQAFDISYRYRRGWRAECELAEELPRKLEFDLSHGFTSVGPQRAEVEILSEGASAEKTLSRGQQKMMVVALNLALIDLMRERQRQAPIVLIDDLAAELDMANQKRVLAELKKRSVQAFVTSIHDTSEQLMIPDEVVFHVEHGRIRA